MTIIRPILLTCLSLSTPCSADFSSLELSVQHSASPTENYGALSHNETTLPRDSIMLMNSSLAQLEKFIVIQRSFYNLRRDEQMNSVFEYIGNKFSEHANQAVSVISESSHPLVTSLIRELNEFSRRSQEVEWTPSLWYSNVSPAYSRLRQKLKINGGDFRLLVSPEDIKSAVSKLAEDVVWNCSATVYASLTTEAANLLGLERDPEILHVWNTVASIAAEDSHPAARHISAGGMRDLIFKITTYR